MAGRSFQTPLDRLLQATTPWLAIDGLDSGTRQAGSGTIPSVAWVRQTGAGLVIDTCTAWAGQAQTAGLGLGPEHLTHLNATAVAYAKGLQSHWPDLPSVVNGMVGPTRSGPGHPGAGLSAWHARMAHSAQVELLARAGVDLITGTAMTHVAEAIGILGAATACGLPCVLSFSVTAQGRLPSGQPLEQAIDDIEHLDAAPLWYGIEGDTLASGLFDPAQHWVQRIGSLRTGTIRDLAPVVARLPALRCIGAPPAALPTALSHRPPAAATRA